MYSGPSAIKNLANPLGDSPMNTEWMTEVCFFVRLRKGGVTLYNSQEEELFWPENRIVHVATVGSQMSVLSNGTAWFKPLVHHQGRFDAVFIDKSQGLVRFVQFATTTRVRHNPMLPIGYFYQFLHDMMRATHAFAIQTVEIFAVVERNELEEFAFATVTGEGLLASYAGGGADSWGQGKDEANVKRVGLERPPSWDKFEW